MQTFMPYRNIEKSLNCLDMRRLGKQRVEAYQIIQTLEKIHENNSGKIGWSSHPAVLMWVDNKEFLKFYFNCSLDIWASRGGNNIKLVPMTIDKKVEEPWWLGNELMHSSHRANLIRKAKENFDKTGNKKMLDWYGQFGWTEEAMKGYYWPTLDKTFKKV